MDVLSGRDLLDVSKPRCDGTRPRERRISLVFSKLSNVPPLRRAARREMPSTPHTGDRDESAWKGLSHATGAIKITARFHRDPR